MGLKPFRLVDELWYFYFEIFCDDVVFIVNEEEYGQVRRLQLKGNEVANALIVQHRAKCMKKCVWELPQRK